MSVRWASCIWDDFAQKYFLKKHNSLQNVILQGIVLFAMRSQLDQMDEAFFVGVKPKGAYLTAVMFLEIRSVR